MNRCAETRAGGRGDGRRCVEQRTPYDEIIARLDEFDPESMVRANGKDGGFWTACGADPGTGGALPQLVS